MITRFETVNPVDDMPLSGMTYTPDNPTAVISIVHGFGEHCGRYAGMMDHLGEHGIASAALDLRGHGRSGGARGVCRDYENMRTDVDCLLDKTRSEFPNLPHFLFGHSMGGGLVLNYVLTRGQKDLSGVIATAPLLLTPEPIPKPLEYIVRMLRRIAPSMTLKNAIDGTKVSTVPAEQAAYEADPLNHGKLGVGLAVNLMEQGQWTLSNAENWNAPLLLMHAKQDVLTASSASQEFAAISQNCTFHMFENVAHEIHNDTSREAVYANITAFVESHL